MFVTRRDVLKLLAASSVSERLSASARQVRPTPELVWLDIASISARIASGTLSAADLTEAYLQHIDRVNPAVMAYVTVTADRARQDAKRVDAALRAKQLTSRLAGVPIAHKDLFETAGIRTTAGSRLFDGYVPQQDATIVARLAAAGTILLGKCNTHELGGGVTTINPFFGTTHNPWDRSRIAGGSSGGSAAAVVSGLAAAATGSDTGGSVRIPAAFCGCVGFKPTFGRVSTAGLLGAIPTFDHSGFLTRTVADIIALYNAAAGYDVRDPSTIPTTEFRQIAPGSSQKGLRVGIPRNYFFETLQSDVARAVEGAIETLRKAGASISAIAYPITNETMADVFDPIAVTEIHERLGRDWRERPEAFSQSFAEFFRMPVPSALEVAAAHRALRGYQSAVRRVFEDVDVVATPTVPITAPAVAGPIDGALILRNTWPFNAARTPAISVPCGVDAAGLPIGLQLAAAPYADEALLRAALTYQGATTWHTRRPQV